MSDFEHFVKWEAYGIISFRERVNVFNAWEEDHAHLKAKKGGLWQRLIVCKIHFSFNDRATKFKEAHICQNVKCLSESLTVWCYKVTKFQPKGSA